MATNTRQPVIPGTQTPIPGTGQTSGGTWNIPRSTSTTPPSTTPSTTVGMGTGGADTLSVTDFNANTYLYDVGLQNIFQDYQKNIATLNQQEQQSLQDAYYIREMSKKYLGQYASNVGIGDVSGNLLDIYGQYQQAVAGIRGQTNMAELGLQQQYDAQRRELELGRTMAEAQGAETIAGWSNVTSPQTFDLNGNVIDNPNYNPNFDIDYYNRPSDWQEGISEVFVDAGGNYKYIGQDVEEEGFGGGLVTHDTITADWQSKPGNEGETLVAGMTHIYQGETFILKEGKWYRFKSFSSENNPQGIQLMMQQQEKNWGEVTDYGIDVNIGEKGIGLYSQGNNLFIINIESGVGKDKPLAYFVRLNESDNKTFDVADATEGTRKEILDKFTTVHGELKDKSAVYFGGKLYFYTDGKVYEMKRRTY